MLFAVLIIVLLGVYLIVEERERRALNPNADRWITRVGRSSFQHLWILGGVAVALGIHVAKRRDPQESILSAAVGLAVYLFVTFHAATLALPRKDKDIPPNQSSQPTRADGPRG